MDDTIKAEMLGATQIMPAPYIVDEARRRLPVQTAIAKAHQNYEASNKIALSLDEDLHGDNKHNEWVVRMSGNPLHFLVLVAAAVALAVSRARERVVLGTSERPVGRWGEPPDLLGLPGQLTRGLGHRPRLGVVVGVISPASVRGVGLGRRTEKLVP